MSGAILPGLALVNNFDGNGDLMRGALLRLYAAGTNTPVTAFKDSALTSGQEHPWPIPADSAARLPMFYLASGDYRVRLASSDGGYVAYDVPIISAVSPSGGGGGGGGGTVSAEVLFQTGDFKIRLGTGVHSGFARCNGGSIGAASSGATERANADTQALYEYLYGEFSDTICPVVGGRGASATADFTANKPLTLPDGRGRTLFGADGMGTSRANRLTTATFAAADSVGTAGGAESYTLTEAQLPVITPTFDGTQGTINSSATSGKNILTGNIVSASVTGGGNPINVFSGTSEGIGSIQGTLTPEGSVSSFGSGASHPAASPGLVVTIYVKL